MNQSKKMLMLQITVYRYEEDPWAWSLDWSVQELRMKKQKTNNAVKKIQEEILSKLRNLSTEELSEEAIDDWYPDLPTADQVLHKRRQHLQGFPR